MTPRERKLPQRHGQSFEARCATERHRSAFKLGEQMKKFAKQLATVAARSHAVRAPMEASATRSTGPRPVTSRYSDFAAQ